MRSRRRTAVSLAATVLIVGACSASTPTEPPSAATAAPTATATPSPSPIPSPAPHPSTVPVTPTAGATPPTEMPTPDAFWQGVLGGLASAGRLRVTVIGPSPGVLRYEPAASATVADGRVVSVCVDGSAYDGQGGSFIVVPGSWTCGGPALTAGFRNAGQPVDAWSGDSPSDAAITETTTVEPDGRWRWDYTGQSAVYGGMVRSTVWVDPATGRILEARRSDPTGETAYGISYDEAFPAIAAP